MQHDEKQHGDLHAFRVNDMNQVPLHDMEFLRTLLDAVPSMLFVVDIDMRVFHLNAAAARTAGADQKTFFMHRGGEVLHCIHEQQGPGGCGQAVICRDCIVRNSVITAVRENQVHQGSATMDRITPGGRAEVHYRITSSPFTYQGERYALLAMEDITALKQAEEALRASETRLRNITSVLGEGLYVLDREGRLTSLNPEAERLLGWAEAELLGKSIHEAVHCDEIDGKPAQTTECPVTKTVGSGATYRNDEDCFRRKDGTRFPASIVSTPLLEHGRPAGSVTAFRDITEQKTAASDLKRLNDLLELQATTDPLTGIANRLKFNETLHIEIRRARRFSMPLSLIMFDVDHFKAINDTFGHNAGDCVLTEIADLVSQNVRAHDLFARWGGEEFLIMATNTVRDNAKIFAEKLRLMIGEHEFPCARQVTCSFGVAQLADDDIDDRFIQRADRALYQAKAGGRNRVETA